MLSTAWPSERPYRSEPKIGNGPGERSPFFAFATMRCHVASL
jgi:hypothetical protein